MDQEGEYSFQEMFIFIYDNIFILIFSLIDFLFDIQGVDLIFCFECCLFYFTLP